MATAAERPCRADFSEVALLTGSYGEKLAVSPLLFGACLEANTASTAASVLGATAADWLAERRLPALLVDQIGATRYVADRPQDGDDR